MELFIFSYPTALFTELDALIMAYFVQQSARTEPMPEFLIDSQIVTTTSDGDCRACRQLEF